MTFGDSARTLTRCGLRQPLAVSLRASATVAYSLSLERCALDAVAFGIRLRSEDVRRFSPHADALRLASHPIAIFSILCFVDIVDARFELIFGINTIPVATTSPNSSILEFWRKTSQLKRTLRFQLVTHRVA